MRYLSVCSGIEAASQAWAPLGWTPVAFSEIDPFPSAVLAHRYPAVPNLGDMTQFAGWPDAEIDLLVGGTPCQSFSIAGMRKGLADPRGNLMLSYLAVAERYQPRWLLWENVTGVLSSGGGRDFGTLLGALADLGYGFAYRVLDAQYVRTRMFGAAVPQSRRRVFVIGYRGNWRRAAAVLFDRESLSGHPPPGREAGKGFASAAGTRAKNRGRSGADDALIPAVSGALAARDYKLPRAEDNVGVIAVAFDCLAAGNTGHAIGDVTGALHGGGKSGGRAAVVLPWAVRRLTPRECERLQGFPDDFTAVPYRGKPAALCPDGPRYKAIGNSMATNSMEWIGERIAEVDTWT